MNAADNPDCAPLSPSWSVPISLSHISSHFTTLLQFHFLPVTRSVLGWKFGGSCFACCLMIKSEGFIFYLQLIVIKAVGNQYDLSKIVLSHLLVCWAQQPCLAVTHSAVMRVGQTAEPQRPALEWVGQVLLYLLRLWGGASSDCVQQQSTLWPSRLCSLGSHGERWLMETEK